MKASCAKVSPARNSPQTRTATNSRLNALTFFEVEEGRERADGRQGGEVEAGRRRLGPPLQGLPAPGVRRREARSPRRDDQIDEEDQEAERHDVRAGRSDVVPALEPRRGGVVGDAPR